MAPSSQKLEPPQNPGRFSPVLHSDRAIQVNIEIMRAFVRLRQLLTSNVELARKLAALESKYDAQFKMVFDAIRELMKPPEPGPSRSRNGQSDSRRGRNDCGRVGIYQ